MVDIDVLGSQVESIPSEVVQFVHIDSVGFVADDIEFPVSDSIVISCNQSPNSLNFGFS